MELILEQIPQNMAGRLIIALMGCFLCGEVCGLEKTVRPSDELSVGFSKKSCVFTSAISVSLDTPGGGKVIRYTIDGSDPGRESPKYGQAFTISASVCLKARVFGFNGEMGPICSRFFIRLHPDLAEFRSRLPIVIIDSWRSGVPTKKEKRSCFIGMISPNVSDGISMMQSGFELECHGLIKRHGSSSSSWPKYSMSFSARNNRGRMIKISPLGLPSGKRWVLSGRYRFDPTLIRNDLAYQLSRDIGQNSPGTKLVEVFVNTDGGALQYRGDYKGVYSLVQKIDKDFEVKISRGGNRLARGGSENSILFKKDYLGMGEEGFQIEGAGGFSWIWPDEAEITPFTNREVISYLSTFTKNLQRGGDLASQEIKQVVDFDSWCAYHWLNTLAKNGDGLINSSHFRMIQGGHSDYFLFAGPVWDFDRSFGSREKLTINPLGWSGAGGSGRTWFDKRAPWWGMVLRDPDFRQAHIDYWFQHRCKGLSWENIEARIDELSVQLGSQDQKIKEKRYGSTPVQRNFLEWSEVQPSNGDWREEVNRMKSWIQKRLIWIDSQYTPMPKISRESGRFNSGFRAVIESSASEVYFTTDGNDPRQSGGDPSPKSKKDTAFEIDRSMVVKARARIGTGLTSWSAPVREVYLVGEKNPTNALKFEKIESNPSPPVNDGEKQVATDGSDFEYLKITNSSQSQTVDLTGAQFTDGIEFSFDRSPITNLTPGESLFVVRNKEAFLARNGPEKENLIAGEYAPTRLDNKGERICLEDGVGTIVLELTYEGEK